jgi:hypothetical protein
MTPIRVVYRKYDGSLHWHMELGRLGADGHGTWLSAPPGSQSRRGSEEPVTFPQAYVLLIPSSGGWTMTCNAEPCWTELYIDITTQPRWTPPEVISDAERSASGLLAAVTSGTEPFGQVCRDWLAKVPGV